MQSQHLLHPHDAWKTKEGSSEKPPVPLAIARKLVISKKLSGGRYMVLDVSGTYKTAGNF